MRRAAFVTLLAHWRRAPLQLVTLLGGLILATALWSAVQAINAEARASYADAASALGQSQPARLVARDGGDLDEADLLALSRAGWKVSPFVEGRLAGLHLIGIDPLTAPAGSAPVTAGEGLAELAAFILPPGEIRTRDGLFSAPVDARIIADPRIAPGTAIADVGVAQHLLGLEGRLSAVLLSPEDAQPLRRPPLADIAPRLRLIPAQEGADIAGLTGPFHLNLTAFGFLAFAVGLFIVQGAVTLALAQRRGTIRTLRALGVSLRQMTALLAAELVLAALLAGAAGVALGQVIATALMPDVARTLQSLYGAGVAATLNLRPSVWLAALGMAVAGTAVAGAGALWQVARMPVLADPLQRRGRGLVWPALALVILVVAGLLSLQPRSMPAALVLLTCLMGGGALILPSALALILRLFARIAPGPLAQWFWADALRALPDLRLALMALLLALATNIGVTTMVSSFRLAFEGFLDQRLTADLQISADPATLARIEDWATGEGLQTLPRLAVATKILGHDAELQGLRDAAAYRDNWHLIASLPDAWDRLADGSGVLINEQLGSRAGLQPGDPLDLGTTLAVVGIHADYGNPFAQVSMGETLFRHLHPEVTMTRLGLVLPPGTDAEGITAALRDRFTLDAGEIADRATIRAASLAIFERTFAVTGALSVLTLAVAGFALFMSLATLATMRLPQIAPLWAMGVRRNMLGRLELARAIGLAALTALLALPLGLALAWVLLAHVNVAAFGWRLPMFLFPGDWLRLGVLALLAAALAGLVPALNLMRLAPARALRVFADET